MRDRIETGIQTQHPQVFSFPMELGIIEIPCYAYYRLSDEEKKNRDESSSISNQRLVVCDYAARMKLVIIKEFVDDGYTGGNFERPDFQNMIRHLHDNPWVRVVVTKDLSRLGRDMQESSYFAETYFPEQGVRYLAPGDDFDNAKINVMAPFNFAFNDVYLRQGSKKVRDILETKRKKGEYCACPPYGYKKETRHDNVQRLIPDEMTAPIVQKIFAWAAEGESSRSIAERLNAEGIIPPLKYRALYRDEFTAKGAARASDDWNWTTVKRILQNEVYLGHTILGKTKKINLKSKKKVKIPKEEWVIHENTHEALVSQREFEDAKKNMASKTKSHYEHPQVRKSIFGKIAYCSMCGSAMCSGGSVYKGEREKYWYLVCNRIREKDDKHCDGVRIRYYDLLELVRNDLNNMISLSDEEIEQMVSQAVDLDRQRHGGMTPQERLEKLRKQLRTAEAGIAKAYSDYVEGRLSNETLSSMISSQESLVQGLRNQIKELEARTEDIKETREKYDQFFQLARQYSHFDELDRETLLTFVERIEIGPKILPEGLKIASKYTPFRQKITIYYRFIGAVTAEDVRDVPRAANY